MHAKLHSQLKEVLNNILTTNQISITLTSLFHYSSQLKYRIDILYSFGEVKVEKTKVRYQYAINVAVEVSVKQFSKFMYHLVPPHQFHI